MRYSRSFYTGLLRDSFISLVAVIDGSIVGIATSRSLPDSPQDAYIMTIGVHPDHQRCGLGAILLQVGFLANTWLVQFPNGVSFFIFADNMQ